MNIHLNWIDLLSDRFYQWILLVSITTIVLICVQQYKIVNVELCSFFYCFLFRLTNNTIFLLIFRTNEMIPSFKINWMNFVLTNFVIAMIFFCNFVINHNITADDSINCEFKATLTNCALSWNFQNWDSALNKIISSKRVANNIKNKVQQ